MLNLHLGPKLQSTWTLQDMSLKTDNSRGSTWADPLRDEGEDSGTIVERHLLKANRRATQTAEMVKAAVFVSIFIGAVLYNLRSASADSQRMTAEGFDVGRPVETACHERDITFQDSTDHMYVGVPSSLFHTGKGKGNTCGEKIKVSCVGQKPTCKTNKPVELTIIDTLDGDFVEISNKAFNIISDFDIGVITVTVTTEF